MTFRPSLLIGIAFILITTLLTGVVLHAAIPHKHSHDGEPVSAVWDSLHSALRGEDKKLLAAIPNSFTVFTSFLLLALILEIGTLSLNTFDLFERKDTNLVLALRRGIVAYRTFG